MGKIYIKTFGCAHNFSDSEVMAGLLTQAGYTLVNEQEQSDIVIVNSCTVKQSAESKSYQAVQHATKLGKKTIIAGCVPQAEQNNQKKIDEWFPKSSVVGVKQINHIVTVVEETLKGNIVRLLKNENNPRLDLPKIRKNKLVEIIPINLGCTGFCTYCKTKQARGGLVSFDPQEIIAQVRVAVRQGIKEVWLTSEDTGAYGKDIGTNLPALLKQIVLIPGDFKIRVGMGNPNHVIGFVDELCEVMQDNKDKIFSFVHIPVQSGNDRVLSVMKRNYAASQFTEIVEKLRACVPNITIATDIICGFPSETTEEFEDTLQMIEKIKPEVVNISRFWLRPGTPAEKMEQIDGEIIKERAKKLKETFENYSLELNKKWIGWKGDIIINEIGKTGTNTFVGRNNSYKPVLVKGNHKIGDQVDVEIKSVGKFDLRGF